MPVTKVQGNIWDIHADAVVVPCNTKGAMGAGLAKQAKERFPPIFYEEYKKYCDSGTLIAGNIVTIYNIHDYDCVICTMTKEDWRNPSQLEWVEDCILTLKDVIKARELKSVALPYLGCGYGKLDKQEVEDIILHHLADSDCNIILVEPL